MQVIDEGETAHIIRNIFILLKLIIISCPDVQLNILKDNSIASMDSCQKEVLCDWISRRIRAVKPRVDSELILKKNNHRRIEPRTQL